MSGGFQSFPHSPRSVPTGFGINSDPELIKGNSLRAEQFSSGSHTNILVLVNILAQRIQGRGVRNIPKPLAGGYELLITHKELSWSGEDHRSLRRMESIVFQIQVQKDKELVEEPKAFIHIPEERVGNDPRFGERMPSDIKQLQTSFISVQRQAQSTSEEAERSQ
ncbi:hypothetical protein O181_038676 [Austropuccinia psidii MF-1]|uniref:Uncharacterized protein n=1 Tax=Austropuccinia psidii MF-1 TaxID=1389203 RepID=A0A9Q3D8D7_9BASI|nr:hypothetical protein [Austropuccinia psidii MF-1]